MPKDAHMAIGLSPLKNLLTAICLVCFKSLLMDTSYEKWSSMSFKQVAIRLSKNYVIDLVAIGAVIDVLSFVN